MKVEQLLVDYGLFEFGDEIERRWLGELGERDSLRTLSTLFNERLLEKAMRDAGMISVKGEVENLYRLLTQDDVSRGVRAEVTSRLKQNGVDVAVLERDFVSYQAIRTYLTQVRGTSYEPRTVCEDRVERARSDFAQLQGRSDAVVDQILEQLRSADEITLGTFRVRTAVTVFCEDCETRYNVFDLLSDRECNC